MPVYIDNSKIKRLNQDLTIVKYVDEKLSFQRFLCCFTTVHHMVWLFGRLI